MKKKLVVLMSLVVMGTIALSGCGNKENINPDKKQEEVKKEDKDKEEKDDIKDDKEDELVNDTASSDGKEEAPDVDSDYGSFWAYIGTEEKGYKEYFAFKGETTTPEQLISAISEATGWNLSLAENVSSGKAGMTISFSSESSIVTGDCGNQLDEYRVADKYDLVNTILDSIQETLRLNYVMDGGDPSSLQVWYNVEGHDIDVDGVIISQYEPWDEQNVF